MPRDVLRDLAEAARAETRLVVRGLTDPRAMRDTIWAAFRAEIAPWAELDYAQDVVGPRLLATIRDARAGARPAVAIVSGPASFDRAGLVAPFTSPSFDRLPAGWRDPGGRWAPIYVQPIVAIHNAYRSLPPGSWDDLGDPTFHRRLVFDDPARMLTTGPALAELSAALGEVAWEAMMARLAAQEPDLVGDNERAVLEVSTGMHWLGLANWNVARRVRPGSPVRHAFLQPTPCVPGFGLLVRDAPAASLGRLFLAWLLSDGGQRAYAATGRIPARPDVDTSPSLGRVLPPGIEAVFGAADWVTEPERWAARFRELLPADRRSAREGKLR